MVGTLFYLSYLQNSYLEEVHTETSKVFNWIMKSQLMKTHLKGTWFSFIGLKGNHEGPYGQITDGLSRITIFCKASLNNPGQFIRTL